MSSARFGLFNTEARILRSTCADEEYQIGIWLPFSYGSSNQTYPVLYVTDGDTLFGLATGLIPTLIGTQEIPEMLVVGIGYHRIATYGEFGKVRERDFLPPGFADAPADSRTPQFQAFLVQELFPLIETEYHGSSEDRTLFGFSAGGFFTLYTMLTQPGLFRRYIAASCTWPGAATYLLACAQQYAQQPFHPAATLYLAAGGLEEEQLPGFQALAGTLRQSSSLNLTLSTQVVEGEAHSAGVIAQAFLQGVRSVFRPG